MPYLVDGHNLIPKLPGFSLRQIDDEERLVAVLVEFQRVRRTQVEVFFDQAPAGRAGQRKAGALVVRHVSAGRLADDAIIERLRQMGKAAKNWTVVSSDRRVQSEAHALGATPLSSEQFVAEVQRAQLAAQQASKQDPPRLNEGEIDEWLRIFNEGPKKGPG